MIETGIKFSHGINAGQPNLIEDIVFVRRKTDGTELFSFSVGEAAKDAAIDFKEVALPGIVGNSGQGFWKITGEVSLFQNDFDTLNAYQSLVGRLLEIHVLYTTGEYRASEYIVAGKRGSFTSNRFNNLEAYRNQFGVYLSLTDSSQNYETVTLTVDGATAIKVNRNITLAEFYGLFKSLNTTAVAVPIATQGSVGF